ncbi:MAG: Ig-like domain-containing protein [Candidatus Zhuqueibacterota bacterium]
MRRNCWHFSLAMLLLFTLTCTEEQPYSIEESFGKIAGLIKPSGIIAQVNLLQGKLIQTTQTDSSGYFILTNVAVGVYNLEFSAEGFGRQFINEISVYSQRTTAIKDVYLKPFPEQVAGLNPADGTTSHPVSYPISIEFNTPMMHSSVEANFILDPEVSGYFRWEDSAEKSKVYFYPDEQFATNTTYQITLTTDANTIYGDTLSFELSASFKSEGIKITNTSPTDQATFISPATYVYIFFNSNMDRATFDENFSIVPAVDGVLHWHNLKQVSFYPYIPLASNTLYAVRIDGKANDVFGSQLTEVKTFAFRTEPLTVSTNYPENGATYVNRSASISISFNTFVNQEKTERAFRLTPAVEGGNFQWYDLSRFQYTGTAKMAALTTYTVTIDTTCTDAWGNSLDKNFSLTFTTGN